MKNKKKGARGVMKKKSSKAVRYNKWGYIFLIPFILVYMIFVVVYMFFMSTNIVPIILWKIKELIPIIGTGLSHGMEYLLSIIGGISPMDVGGNIFTIQYQWIMVLALPLILSYNHQRGKKCKYLFYIFYPIHIILLWLLSNFVFV